MKRTFARGSPTNCSASSLTATVRPSTRSSADHTEAMPPLATWVRISKRSGSETLGVTAGMVDRRRSVATVWAYPDRGFGNPCAEIDHLD
jgi:hypothetical protein